MKRALRSGVEGPSAKRSAIDDRPAISCFADVNDILSHLRSQFPQDKFVRTPPIIWKHQLYALMKNRTQVDRQLHQLCQSGRIRFFKLGSTLSDNEVAIVLMDDFVKFARNNCQKKSIIIDRFLNKVVKECACSTFTSADLKNKYNFNDDNIGELMKVGLLAAHHINVGCWLLSVPNAGEFVKNYVDGRKSVIAIIRKSKFQEISRVDLFRRKLPKHVKLGLQFYIYDLLGSDTITSFESSTGIVYRLNLQ